MPNPHHERILRYFKYEHLPQPLKAVSRHFNELANVLVNLEGGSDIKIHDGAEMSVALRKLLEAKDAAVRAVLP